MCPVDPLHRRRLLPLFEKTKAARTIVDCVLQGHGGAIWVDDEDAPRLARITLGPITIFGGDANAPSSGAMVDAPPELLVVIGDDKQWRDLVVVKRPRARVTQRTSFLLRDRNTDRLTQMAGRVLDGCRVERVDLRLARRIGTEVTRDLLFPSVFEGPEDFVARSVGYCAIDENRIVAGATAAVPYDSGFEIQVNTNENYRGRGLATAVSASLILHALREGMEPHWDTGSSISAGLARKLGYAQTGTYEVLELDG